MISLRTFFKYFVRFSYITVFQGILALKIYYSDRMWWSGNYIWILLLAAYVATIMPGEHKYMVSGFWVEFEHDKEANRQ